MLSPPWLSWDRHINIIQQTTRLPVAFLFDNVNELEGEEDVAFISNANDWLKT